MIKDCSFCNPDDGYLCFYCECYLKDVIKDAIGKTNLGEKIMSDFIVELSERLADEPDYEDYLLPRLQSLLDMYCDKVAQNHEAMTNKD